MALNVAEGEAMVKAASESQRILAIGLVRRFMPAAQAIHSIVSQKLLGDVKSFYFSEGRVFRWPVQSASYFRDNGVLRDIGVHVLDLLIHWFGEPEEIIYERRSPFEPRFGISQFLFDSLQQWGDQLAN
jgi:predicted dehydrogenase